MSTRTRRWSVLTAFVLTLALAGASCTKNTQAFVAATLINDARASRGLPSLQLDERLVGKAQAWAEAMAERGSISHSSLAEGVGTGWSTLAENVGFAYSVDEAHRLFMNSASHKASILSRSYTKFGTGVAISDGKVYVVHEFGS